MPPKDAEAQGASSGGGGCSDRLSGLSDRTLIRILSHLKAWEAVRTCALSKRWGGLWAYASRLDIRQPCCCRSPMALGLGEPRTEAFASFVKNLLLRRRSLQPLDALRLCWSHEAHDGDANTWIAHAFRHGAKEIELSGKHHAVYPLPEYMSFIACDDYTKIRLKTLKLIHLKLDDTTLTQLCSRCSCLEELELTDCRIPAKKIQSTLLKRLTMIRCEIPRGLLVYAPNLVSLWCSRTFGYVPWIENLGPLGADNIKQRAPRKYPDCPGLVSCNLKILKISRVQLDDTTLTRLWSRCTFLEELELKDCLVDGREIRSTSLRCLTLNSCKFAIESGVHAPNLVSLRCIKPFQYVPWIRNMEFLVTASIVLDDSCLPPDRQWPQDEHDQDESDHDGDFFYAGAAESDDNSDGESDDNIDDESDHDDNIFAHSGAEDSDDNNDNKSDPERDTDDYYDPGCSEPGDEEDDDCTVGYGEIAEEYKDQPSWYVNQGHNQSEDDPSNDCGGKFGGEGCINLGGNGMLRSLSNVRTMDLLAHSGEEKCHYGMFIASSCVN
ncbi:putative F-box/FBD/LRR-repeat protein At5g62970 isoform X2 [Phragmites australis]|uniref:putative F-box/FBD/LRR-repeat protein At5g62970 isoform X2 n=1 Tax=Phragmites australis TaxID=29695 RepID=UPI002D79D891|nr:putative F-box/FBD/LRR-repeat protein At5g62970 isoform X2 [Phragmites australis]